MPNSIYTKEVLLASLCAAIGTPYVLLTNTTASAAFILIHVLALWILIPGTIWILRRVLRPGTGILNLTLIRLTGLTVSVISALFFLKVFADLDWSVLIVKPLFAALVPLYSWYLIASIYDGFQSERSAALALAAENARAQMRALNAKIQPHFLYNTLTGLEEVIGRDPVLATGYVQDLATLYRAFLGNLENAYTTVKNEVSIAESFLKLQKMRFGNRFDYQIRVDDSCCNNQILSNVLLTLLENAFKHGVEQRQDPSVVEILFNGDSETRLEVRNTTNQRTLDKENIGLKDIRSRLTLAYGNENLLQTNLSENQFVASVKMPQRKSREA